MIGLVSYDILCNTMYQYYMAYQPKNYKTLELLEDEDNEALSDLVRYVLFLGFVPE